MSFKFGLSLVDPIKYCLHLQYREKACRGKILQEVLAQKDIGENLYLRLYKVGLER
jgi:hypothetical protein